MGEVLQCVHAERNAYNSFAMSLKKTGTGTMNHVPHTISCICTLFLSTIEVTVIRPQIYVFCRLFTSVTCNQLWLVIQCRVQSTEKLLLGQNGQSKLNLVGHTTEVCCPGCSANYKPSRGV